ncbi:hypothetical protein ANN_05878 [Periplaneta americana]|uniref:Uncharacterized protein n=1 Tax=Periplaneta americana TaxID=6978 RepID=A0ABQ8TC14_PERAM|nr:hypothetical protein ANN_05878 [Periplaneta americana]
MAGLCEDGNEPPGSLKVICIEKGKCNSESVLLHSQEEEKELAGSLAEKKLPTEGCTGRNGEREKSSWQKKISDDRRH